MVMDELKYKDGKFTVNGIDVNSISATSAITEAVEIAQTVSANTQQFSVIDNPEYLDVTIDSDNRVLDYIDTNGNYKHNTTHKFESIVLSDNTKIINKNNISDISREDLLKNHLNDLEKALKEDGFQPGSNGDWSEEPFVEIPIPSVCAKVNLVIDHLPNFDGDAQNGYIEFYDKDGNFFKKPITGFDWQGDSSKGMPWKNYGFDINDGSKIKFGNWVPQDSFHMKKYYIDVFRGQCVVAYHLAEQMYQTRSFGNRKPFEYLLKNDNIYSSGGVLNKDFSNGALCHPDGFPVMAYVNGKLLGLFSFNLKKHRDNYAMDKSTPEHILLDGTLNISSIWAGSINWSEFEIRNPKGLLSAVNSEIVSGEHAYEPFEPTVEEIASIGNNYQEVLDKPSDWTNADIIEKYGDNPPQYLYMTSKEKWYRLIEVSGYKFQPYDGDHPTEIVGEDTEGYDPTNKDHVFCNKVKQYILNLSKCIPNVTKASTDEEKKEILSGTFKIDELIDYFIYGNVTYDRDGFSKNWLWTTWDGKLWSPVYYDKDSIFGSIAGSGFGVYGFSTTQILGNSAGLPTYYPMVLYQIETEERYKELRDKGVYETDNIVRLLEDWVNKIGYNNLKTDLEEVCVNSDKKPVTPSYRQSNLKDGWRVYDILRNYPKFDPLKTYNAGDICETSNLSIIAEKTIEPSDSPYAFMYTEPPVAGGYYNSLQRVNNWLNLRFSNLDQYYHKNNN